MLSYSIHVLLNRVKDQLAAGNLDVTISEVTISSKIVVARVTMVV